MNVCSLKLEELLAKHREKVAKVIKIHVNIQLNLHLSISFIFRKLSAIGYLKSNMQLGLLWFTKILQNNMRLNKFVSSRRGTRQCWCRALYFSTNYNHSRFTTSCWIWANPNMSEKVHVINFISKNLIHSFLSLINH